MGWCTEGITRGGLMDGFGRGGFGMMGHGRFMFPFFGFFVFAVVAVAVVLFVIWLVRRSGHAKVRAGNGSVVDTPLFVAKRRLAAGEITAEEFERIRGYLADHEEA